MKRTLVVVATLGCLLAPAAHASTAQQLCESAIELASAKFTQCRLTAESKYSKTLDAVKRTAALDKCSDKLAGSYSRATTAYGAANCPAVSSGAIDTYLTQCADDTTAAAGGASLPNYPAEIAACEADLAAAQVCGNGVKDATEECDSSDLGSSTCATEGYAGGTLRCASSACVLDTSGCYLARFVDNGDGTVTDKQTNLVWEKKTTSVGSGQNYADPHDVDNTYTWGDASDPYAPTGTAFTDFLGRLNGRSDGSCFTGKCDWRLPTPEELHDIVDLTLPGCGSGQPCINTLIFGASTLFNYWSSSTYGVSPVAARGVSFFDGGDQNQWKSNSTFVRAVRGGSGGASSAALPPARLLKSGQTTAYGAGSDGDLQKGVAQNFVDNGDGTITDMSTGLMWEKKSDDGSIHDKDNTYTWSGPSLGSTNVLDGTAATTFLAALNAGGGFAGHTDWRLPNIKELQSLNDFGGFSPSTFPAFNTNCGTNSGGNEGCTVTTCSCTATYFGSYWSSSTYVGSVVNAWRVYFIDGPTQVSNKGTLQYVRAVRGGP